MKRTTYITYLLRIILPVLLIGVTETGLHAQGKKLITDVSQIINNFPDNNVKGILLDESSEATVTQFSDYGGGSFVVRLRDNDVLNEGDFIAVFFKRATEWQTDYQPTVIKVEGSSDNSNYENLGFYHLLFSGVKTEEFSERIRIKSNNTRYIRVSAYDNVGHVVIRYYGDDSALTAMTQNSGFETTNFNIYKIGATGSYTNNWADNLYLNRDFDKRYEDYTLEHTLGIADIHNQSGLNEGWGLPDWSRAVMNSYEAKGIYLPDYTMWGVADQGETVKKDPYNRVKRGLRQPTHVTEHTVYAVPGDVVGLFPYLDMHEMPNYFERFSHWYDYANDGRLRDSRTGVDMLGFLNDPIGVARNESGFFAGSNFVNNSRLTESENSVFEIYNIQDFVEFCRKHKDANNRFLSAILMADLDFAGDATGVGDKMIGLWHEEGCFRGEFDGNGHTIRNYRLNDGYSEKALFKTVSGGAYIHDLIIENADVYGSNYCAVLIGRVQRLNDGKPVQLNNIVIRNSQVSADADNGCSGIVIADNQKEDPHSVIMNNVAVIDCKIINRNGDGVNTGQKFSVFGYLHDNTNNVLKNCYATGVYLDGVTDDNIAFLGNAQVLDSYIEGYALKSGNYGTGEYRMVHQKDFLDPITRHDGNTIYVKNETGWKNITAWAWEGDPGPLERHPLGEWPGMAPTGKVTMDGEEYIYFDLGELNTGHVVNVKFIGDNYDYDQIDAIAKFKIDRDLKITLNPGGVSHDGRVMLLDTDNGLNWNEYYLYCWNPDGSQPYGAWPGKAFNEVILDPDGKKFLYADLGTTVGADTRYIINNGQAVGEQFDVPVFELTGDNDTRNYYVKVRNTAIFGTSDTGAKVYGDIICYDAHAAAYPKLDRYSRNNPGVILGPDHGLSDNDINHYVMIEGDPGWEGGVMGMLMLAGKDLVFEPYTDTETGISYLRADMGVRDLNYSGREELMLYDMSFEHNISFSLEKRGYDFYLKVTPEVSSFRPYSPESLLDTWNWGLEPGTHCLFVEQTDEIKEWSDVRLYRYKMVKDVDGKEISIGVNNVAWPGIRPSGIVPDYYGKNWLRFDLTGRVEGEVEHMVINNGVRNNSEGIIYHDLNLNENDITHADWDFYVEYGTTEAQISEYDPAEGKYIDTTVPKNMKGGAFQAIFVDKNGSNGGELMTADGKRLFTQPSEMTINGTSYYYYDFGVKLAPGYVIGDWDDEELSASLMEIRREGEILTIIPSGTNRELRFRNSENVYYHPAINDYQRALIDNGCMSGFFENSMAGKGYCWPPISGGRVAEKSSGTYTVAIQDARRYGATATFYKPLEISASGERNYTLLSEDDEYTVAADFAVVFNYENNIDFSSRKIIEPTIGSRHIFHIKDGKKFADEYMTTSDGNRKYLDMTRRSVTARAGYDFQVKLDDPVPVLTDDKLPKNSKARTNYYYRDNHGGYSRVAYVKPAVSDANNPNVSVNQGMFFLDAHVRGAYDGKKENSGEMTRVINGMTYTVAGGGKEKYNRMIFVKGADAREGKYLVRLMAYDVDGNKILLDNGEQACVKEYLITFVSEMGASVLTENRLYGKGVKFEGTDDQDKFLTHRAEYLGREDVAGEPQAVVNFDEFRWFEQETDRNKFLKRIEDIKHTDDRMTIKNTYMYRWPLSWDQASYTYSYGAYEREKTEWVWNTYVDFNVYVIASHTNQVQYADAAHERATERFKNGVSETNDYGLFDRLHYDSGSQQNGYFFYVNAASDPGVMARLRINDLCMGSTVAVSAWAAEMSNEPEVANVGFNFIAVTDNGERYPLHTFVSGYIDNKNYGTMYDRHKGEDIGQNDEKKDGNGHELEDEGNPNIGAKHGQWMHIYYSFIPDISSLGDAIINRIDHYELELENNCVSSIGADYAIDDIRAYVVRPRIEARQLTPVCRDVEEGVDVQVGATFDLFVQAAGETPVESENGKGKKINMIYSFVDKEIYDRLYAESGDAGYTDAFTKALVHYDYDRTGNSTGFGHVNFSSKYSENKKYDDNKIEQSSDAFRTEINGERYIVFNTNASDVNLKVGREYYVLVTPDFEGRNNYSDSELAGIFMIQEACAQKGILRVQGGGYVRVDGEPYADNDPIEVCVGQAPVIQIVLQQKKQQILNGEINYEEVSRVDNPYFDWYVGSKVEFDNEYFDEAGTISLQYLLEKLRSVDMTLEEIRFDSDENGNETVPERFLRAGFTKEQWQYLYEMTRSKVKLHSSSYVFPPISAPENEISYKYLVAMPLFDDKKFDLYCTEPTEVKLGVHNYSPLMLDGFVEGVDYPADMTDVPVRASLRQLEKASAREIGKVNLAESQALEIPLRDIQSVTKGVMGMMTVGEDPLVYLVETNDPLYRNLDSHPEGQALVDPTLTPGEGRAILPIGFIKELKAELRQGVNLIDNIAKIVFSKDMKFREGYYYRVRFDFKEMLEFVDGVTVADQEKVCDGQLVFTVKVVPEYQKWTGADNLNWNNDLNWERVTGEEILLESGRHEDVDYMRNNLFVTASDGHNDRRFSYAPLDFTKVVIPDVRGDEKSKGFPVLSDAVSKPAPANIRTIYSAHNAGPEYFWSNDPDNLRLSNGSMQAATENVKYDMAAMEIKNNIAGAVNKTAIGCRPWYANTCEEIHFNWGSEILRQQYFRGGADVADGYEIPRNYRKAWVDMDMNGSRWYTLSTPLQGVVAGDMYLPTADGKQATELFQPISFDKSLHDRFHPAVYQRGWNKAQAKVVRLEEGNTDSAIRLDWSHVYNDVEEAYSGGLGFSIRTDLSSINRGEDSDRNVRFRLPKADANYDYWTEDQGVNGDNTSIAGRDKRHYLNEFAADINNVMRMPVTVRGMNAETEYFLLGNPFMARLDMQKFFEENSNVEPMYWIVSDNVNGSAVFSESGIVSNLETTDARVLSQMQGFFVKSKRRGTSLTVNFTPEMIYEGELGENGTRLKIATRSRENAGMTGVRISALVKGASVSSTVLNLDPQAESGYDSKEDAALLIDPTLDTNTTVYTMAGDKAVMINSRPELEMTEIGLMADEESETELLFENVGGAGEMMLLDTLTGEKTPIEEGMVYGVKGKAKGRLFITAGTVESAAQAMSIKVEGRLVTVTGIEEGVAASLYSPAGINEGRYSDSTNTLTFELDPGIHIIDAESGEHHLTRKVIVK